MNDNLPKGFRLSAAGAGFRKAGRDDLGFVLSEVPAVTAGVFTTNAFKAAPVRVCMERLEQGIAARGVVVNAGQANACTGDKGREICMETLRKTGQALGVDETDILPMSTGVIGDQIPLDLWEKALPELAANLGRKNIEDFTRAMMTTDAFPKFGAREIRLSGGMARICGMAKGAGMICPNMATMLSVVLCDAEVAKEEWTEMFRRAVQNTFNRVSVDGDTSTNDTLLGLANGASGVKVADEEDKQALYEALEDILGKLAYMLVQDGEGASKVIKIEVRGAHSDADAELAARTMGHSQLVKTAMYGRDANWGRIVAALGRSGAHFAPGDVRVSLCGVELFRNEQPVGNDADKVLEGPLKERDLHVEVVIGEGPGQYILLASDLTHDYVTCNAAYRS